jgi:hypothetical protein
MLGCYVCNLRRRQMIVVRTYRAIAHRVLAVARVNTDIGDWTVYIDAVPGENYEEEWEKVERHGDKCSEAMGEVIFPEFAGRYEWRH